MKGEVEKVWKNETEDGRKYEVFQINGERYSLWEEDYLDKIQQGQALEFDYKESGDFKNITKIYEPGEEKANEKKCGCKRSEQIVKMSCLRSASAILAGSEIPCSERAEKTIETARRFEKYLYEEGFDEPGGQKNSNHGQEDLSK